MCRIPTASTQRAKHSPQSPRPDEALQIRDRTEDHRTPDERKDNLHVADGHGPTGVLFVEAQSQEDLRDERCDSHAGEVGPVPGVITYG